MKFLYKLNERKPDFEKEDYCPVLKKWYAINVYPSVNGLSVYFKDITERKLADVIFQSSFRFQIRLS